MSSKKLIGRQLQNFRSEVAKLKEKGLVSSRVDARSQRATRYMRDQIKKYRDVLDGKVKVVKAPTRKAAKDFSQKFRTKFNRVVIPVKSKTASARYSKKSKTIILHDTENGRRIKKTLSPRIFESVRDMPRGDNIGYRIVFAGGSAWTFDDLDDLQAFMFPYETNSRNPFRNWERYVEIVDIDEDGEIEE
jgi:hypothetical protein